jgi:hypothetical protein
LTKALPITTFLIHTTGMFFDVLVVALLCLIVVELRTLNKSKLSQSNAKAGVRKVALEYKVMELDMSMKPPLGFDFGKPINREGLGKKQTTKKGRIVPYTPFPKEGWASDSRRRRR